MTELPIPAGNPLDLLTLLLGKGSKNYENFTDTRRGQWLTVLLC